jgi:hypothetical protein
MSILPLIVATIALAMIYGLLWHNQPAHERDRPRDNNKGKNGLRATLGLKSPR